MKECHSEPKAKNPVEALSNGILHFVQDDNREFRMTEEKHMKRKLMNICYGMVGMTFLLLPLNAFADTYWSRGLWVGAVSGAVVGGATFAGITTSQACDPTESDFEICNNGSSITIMTLGGMGLGAIVGAGVGTLVGASWKKSEAVKSRPKTYAGRGTIIGGAIGVGLGGLAVGIPLAQDSSDDAGLKTAVALANAGVVGLVGMGIGAGIGSLFKRDQSQTLLMPYIMPDGHGGIMGGMNMTVVGF